MSAAASLWQPGHYRKRMASSLHAPALARTALVATAIGIPREDLDNALLLASELVTNAVRHSGSEWIDIAISLSANALRIEVADESNQSIRPRTPDADGGWGLALVGMLATRWGVERRSGGKLIWIELDLGAAA